MPFAATRTFPSAAPPCPDALEQLFEKLLRVPGEGAGVRQRRERGGVCFLGAPARSGRAARGRRGGIELFRAVEVGLARLIDEGAQLGETLTQESVFRILPQRSLVFLRGLREPPGAGVHLADLGAAHRRGARLRLFRLGAAATHHLARLQQRPHGFHAHANAFVVRLLGEVRLEVLDGYEQLAAPDRPLGLLLEFGGTHRYGLYRMLDQGASAGCADGKSPCVRLCSASCCRPSTALGNRGANPSARNRWVSYHRSAESCSSRSGSSRGGATGGWPPNAIRQARAMRRLRGAQRTHSGRCFASQRTNRAGRGEYGSLPASRAPAACSTARRTASSSPRVRRQRNASRSTAQRVAPCLSTGSFTSPSSQGRLRGRPYTVVLESSRSGAPACSAAAIAARAEANATGTSFAAGNAACAIS